MAWYEGKVRYFEEEAAPGIGDDKNDGFEVGDVWLDLVANIAYRCLDTSVGAAVWNAEDEPTKAEIEALGISHNSLSDVSSNNHHTQGADTSLGAQAENLNMNTHKIVGVVDPTTDQEAATKKYVDDNADGIEFATAAILGTL